MTDKKQKMQAIVRALLEKTPENGATEAESLAAAAKARELMDKHQISVGKDLKDQRCVLEASPWWPIEVVKRLSSAAWGIMQLTDTFIVLSGPSQTRHRIKVLGLPEDVELALYLWDVCTAHEKMAWNEYKKTDAYAELRQKFSGGVRLSPKAIRRSLTVGFSDRIAERLEEMAKERKRSDSEGTNALVVVKEAIVEEARSEFGLDGTKEGRKVNLGILGPDSAGREAAEQVQLGRPIEEKTSKEKISQR